MTNYRGTIGIVTLAGLAASPVMADTSADIDAKAQQLRQSCSQKYDGKIMGLEATAQCIEGVDAVAGHLRFYDGMRGQLQAKLENWLLGIQVGRDSAHVDYMAARPLPMP